VLPKIVGDARATFATDFAKHRTAK
jgi:hypothetical protein